MFNVTRLRHKSNLARFRRAIELVNLGLPRSRGFWLGLLVASLQAVSAVALLATSAWLISRAAEMPPVLYLQLAVVGVRGFALGRAFFRYVERIMLHDAAFRQLAQMRPRVFASLIAFAPAAFGRLRSAELLSHITSDVDELQFLPLRVISPLVQSAIVTILSVVGLSLLVPQAALVLAITCLLAFFVAMPLSGWSARRTNATNAGERALLSAETLKLFESLDELRAFGWAGSQLDQIEQAQSKLANSAKSAAWSQGRALMCPPPTSPPSVRRSVWRWQTLPRRLRLTTSSSSAFPTSPVWTWGRP